MDTKFEITREQYERFKADPTPGFAVDMECRYFLTPEPESVEPPSPIIVGNYTGRRSYIAQMVLVDAAKMPMFSGDLTKAAGIVDELLEGTPPMYSRVLSRRLAERMAITTPVASRYIRQLICLGMVGFINP
jgi:hypothetical protein